MVREGSTVRKRVVSGISNKFKICRADGVAAEQVKL